MSTPLPATKATKPESTTAAGNNRTKAQPAKRPGHDEIVREALRTPGKGLDGPVRDTMENYFGRSFADVRIHADERAAASARALGAAAFTTGSSIVFDGGHYAPSSREGARLLAHELAHVAHGARATEHRPGVAPPSARAEAQADRAAESALLQPQADWAGPGVPQWGPAWEIHRQVTKITKKGKVENTGEVGRLPGAVGVPYGSVEVRTGEEIELGGAKIPNVIALAYSGLLSADMHPTGDPREADRRVTEVEDLGTGQSLAEQDGDFILTAGDLGLRVTFGPTSGATP